MQRNPHSYQIATGYRTFYSLSLIYQPIKKKRLFFIKKASVLITANIIVTNFALTAFRTDILFFPSSTFLS